MDIRSVSGKLVDYLNSHTEGGYTQHDGLKGGKLKCILIRNPTDKRDIIFLYEMKRSGFVRIETYKDWLDELGLTYTSVRKGELFNKYADAGGWVIDPNDSIKLRGIMTDLLTMCKARF